MVINLNTGKTNWSIPFGYYESFKDGEALSDYNLNNIIKIVSEGIENENDSLIELDSSVYLDQVIEELFSDINEDNELKDLLTEFAKFKLTINKSWDISYDLKDFGLFIDKESNRAQVKYFKKINFNSFSEIKSQIVQIKNQNNIAIRDLLKNTIDLLHNNGLDDDDFRGGYFTKYLKNSINEDNFSLNSFIFVFLS